MIILLFIVFITLSILCCVIYEKNRAGDWCELLEMLFGGLAFIMFIALVVLSVKCIGTTKIDDIIAMYEEENEAIEKHMAELVEGYMDYEKDTLKEFSPDSSITLVSLYPELKSDELVKRQLDTYLDNINRIKDLKRGQIYSSVYRWWLYFGG